MYKRTITSTDYFGQERKEDVYFNLNYSELTKLQLSTQRGYVNMLQDLIDKNDGPTIMKTFDDIIRMAYGEKSEDGRRFIKSPELSEAFTQTPMYDQLYMELCTDAKAAADFVNGIIPQDLRGEASKQNVVTMARQN